MKQLKITDLSVGDWVKVDDEYRMVRGIDATTGLISLYSLAMPCCLGVVRPIPITPEILEQNGFVKNLGIYYHSEVLFELERVRDTWHRTVNAGEYDIYEIKYVHQLQHALRLEGANKEIRL